MDAYGKLLPGVEGSLRESIAGQNGKFKLW